MNNQPQISDMTHTREGLIGLWGFLAECREDPDFEVNWVEDNNQLPDGLLAAWNSDNQLEVLSANPLYSGEEIMGMFACYELGYWNGYDGLGCA